MPVPAVDPSRGPGSRNRRTSTDPAIKRSRSEYDRRSIHANAEEPRRLYRRSCHSCRARRRRARAEQRDTIVTNGKILTVDAGFSVVQALAIDNGRIVARGTSQEVARYVGPDTRVIDVAGATVIPGLIDNHFHFTRGADTWHQQSRFEGVDSRREALRILAAKAASLSPGEWIMVQGGWTPRQFADAPGGFTLEELDGVAPKNPLFVQEGYSVVYANSLALKAVGLNPADGARRNAQGLVSFQPPMALYDAMPKTSAAQREQNLTDFMRALNAVGLTGVYSLGQSDFLAARAAKGPLPIRLWETLPFNATDPASATKAAALIERSRPNQFDGQFGIFGLGEVLYGPFFDLAPRKEPWPAAIMNEYGKLATAAARARLARPSARDQQQRRDGPARYAGAGEQDPAHRSSALDDGPRLRHLAGQHRARESARHDARRARRRDAGRRTHAAETRLPTAASCSVWARTPRSSRTTPRSSRWAGSSADSTSAATACSTRR